VVAESGSLAYAGPIVIGNRDVARKGILKMSDGALDRHSFKVSNFKCFGNAPNGFEEIKTINVIIGRNNSGKSALLDLIRAFVEKGYEIPRHLWYANTEPCFSYSVPISNESARNAFGNYYYQVAQIIGDAAIQVSYRGTKAQEPEIIGTSQQRELVARFEPSARRGILQQLASRAQNLLSDRVFRRLSADRNIQPELDSPLIAAPYVLNLDGVGATNIIQNYLNQAKLARELIEIRLLEALNYIFSPDAEFNRILCRQLGNIRLAAVQRGDFPSGDDGKWEVFLEEDNKGLIPLSHSGSGLKTVILVLLNLLVIPSVLNSELSRYVFAFEELENNLHPSLLRRLLAYIANEATEHKFLLFLTTHSNVTIDFFATDADAQLIHVRHDGRSAQATTVKTYLENCGILDDLDVRASDLLQANSVIWVEGPSDRTYLNRWISLWSNDSLKEGKHYQCVFYGGALLKHLEADSPDECKSGVAILRLARHACVIMDRDRDNGNEAVKPSVARIAREISEMGGIAWITKGREIENYIPLSVFAQWKPDWNSTGALDPYEKVFALMDRYDDGLGAYYSEKKPLFAAEILPHMDLDSCRSVLDLDERMTELCSKIREWNGMPE
jgi:hypothetical protein